MGEYAGMFVKNEYYKEGEAPEKSADVQIAIQLKEENKAFKVEKYEHSLPALLAYRQTGTLLPARFVVYPRDRQKDRLIALNHEINWKPESTGSGRFGKWLENVNDWNLSRSRFWGNSNPDLVDGRRRRAHHH